MIKGTVLSVKHSTVTQKLHLIRLQEEGGSDVVRMSTMTQIHL